MSGYMRQAFGVDTGMKFTSIVLSPSNSYNGYGGDGNGSCLVYMCPPVNSGLIERLWSNPT